jgi:hypothetical protein
MFTNPTQTQLLEARRVRDFIRSNPGCGSLEITRALSLKSCHCALRILLDRNAILKESGRTYTIRKV